MPLFGIERLPRIRSVGGYREYAPPLELERVVDACWIYSVPAAAPVGPPETRHRVLPELGLSLYFQCWRDEAGRVSHGEVNLQGPIREVQLFAPSGALHIEAVRIKPEWSRDLFSADPSEHVNGYASYRAIRRVRANRLHDRLVRTTTSDHAVHVLLHEIRELLAAAVLRRSLVLAHTAAEAIRMSARASHLVDVARASRITERHLRRVIREATGIGAKRFQRIDRLNRAVSRADRSVIPSWASIAADSGFYDQSHMIQEFRALTGSAPVELHAERQAEGSHNDGYDRATGAHGTGPKPAR